VGRILEVPRSNVSRDRDALATIAALIQMRRARSSPSGMRRRSSCSAIAFDAGAIAQMARDVRNLGRGYPTEVWQLQERFSRPEFDRLFERLCYHLLLMMKAATHSNRRHDDNSASQKDTHGSVPRSSSFFRPPP
jgi:hypothetical protein